MFEGYTALSFAAAKTERLRFRLLVGGVTYRHPGLLAKTVTTLDVLSGGRAELGLGARGTSGSIGVWSVPFPPLSERYERLEETLQICFQMWSDDNGAYEGTHYQLAETLCSPRPVSSPRPRVLIGGGGERKTPRLVATYADACNFIGDAATVAHKVDVLRHHCDDVGRDPEEMEVTALIGVAEDADRDTILREVEALAAAGRMPSWSGRRDPSRRSGSRRHGGRSCRPSPGSAERSGCHRVFSREPYRQLTCSRGPLAHPEEQGTFGLEGAGRDPGGPLAR